MKLTNISLSEKAVINHSALPRIEKYDHSVAVPSVEPQHWVCIKALGFGGENAEKSEQDNTRELKTIASLLSTIGMPFSLLCERMQEDNQISFAIGSSSNIMILSALRAAFGIVKTEEYTPQFEPLIGYYATRFIACKTDEEELRTRKPFNETETSNWADEVARVLSDYAGSVRLDFYPVEKSACQTVLQNAENTVNQIKNYIETDVSVSDQSAFNPTKNLIGNLGDKIHGDSEKTDLSGSVSLSWQNNDAALEAQQKEEAFYAELYRLANIEGWVIDFSISADSHIGKYDAATKEDRAFGLMESVSAMIVNAGFTCSWEQFGKSIPKPEHRGLVIPCDRAKEFISLPSTSFYGFERMENHYYNVNLPHEAKGDKNRYVKIAAHLLQYNRPTGIPVYLPENQLNRHVFVCGMTGSGKSNTVHQLLSNIGDLPFLAIEPVKSEYHSLPGVTAYTMTAGSRNALVLNPFWFPKGSNLQYHIDCIKQIISSAFDLYAAMPNILEQCLNRVYQHCGWDLIQGTNHYENILPDDMLYPTFSDLCREVDIYLEKSKFGAESKGNYQGALLSRLQSFTSGSKGMLLNTPAHIDFENWKNRKIVISLDALADDADKSIVMGVILTQYFQFLKLECKNTSKKGLRHLTVVEEAHHLFSGDAQASSGSAEGGSGQSASADFVKTLNNMLAEIRSYGEGFIIVDQSPSALHPGVLKNTGVKIVHRTDYGEDVHALQEALLLENDNFEPAMLESGQALLRFGGMRTCSKVYFEKCTTKENSGSLLEEVHGNSVVNHLLEDEVLNEVVKETIIEQFLNHLLYDELSNFKNVYAELYGRVSRLLIVYGHYEIVGEEECEKNLSKYLISLLPGVIEKMFPSQYSLAKLIVFFAQRFMLIANESCNRISEQEIGAFEDYRSEMIWVRINRFWDALDSADITRVKFGLRVLLPETELIAILAKELHSLQVDYTKREAVFQNLLRKKYFIVTPASAHRLFPYVNQMVKLYSKEKK